MKALPRPSKRPAEYASVVAAIAAVLASLGVDLSAAQFRTLTAVVGLVAAVVTWWRARRETA